MATDFGDRKQRGIVSRGRCGLLIAGVLFAIVSLPAIQSRAFASEASVASKNQVDTGTVRLPGHMMAAPRNAVAINGGAVEARQNAAKPIVLTVVMKRDDQAGFEKYLHDVYDRKSANYRHFLTQREISDRFGPSSDAYQTVINFFRANGFRMIQGSANRLTASFEGTRAKAEKALAIRFHDYRLGTQRRYMTDNDPALPHEIAAHVHSIAGLSSLPRPRPAIVATEKNIAVASCEILAITCVEAAGVAAKQNWVKYCLNTLAQANGNAGVEAGLIASLSCSQSGGVGPSPSMSQTSGGAASVRPLPHRLTSNGTGQTIALVEFDKYKTSDVSDYLNFVGFPSTEIGNLAEVPVNGGATAGPNESEVLLDIDTVMTLAPGAKVVVYDAPFSGPGTSFQALFNAAINGGATVISNSWAYCEDQTSLADAQGIDTIFQTAAASGISVFNGSGDTGNTCLDGSAGVIGVPADSPNATAVGGSSLTLGHGFTYGGESWWNGLNATPPTGQGGYGVSNFFSRPAYQSPLNSSAMRSIPDVVFNADPANGVEICQADNGGCPSGLIYGGTSYSAPVWAAFAAILNQGHGAKLGFLNPLLYPLFGSNAFHDAASMGSDFDHVGPGEGRLSASFKVSVIVVVLTPSADTVVGLAPIPACVAGGVTNSTVGCWAI